MNFDEVWVQETAEPNTEAEAAARRILFGGTDFGIEE